MKYLLAIILSVLVLFLSYIVFSPYLLMSLRFRDHWEATDSALENLMNWVND